jgi:two-component system NtrC family sensor kinase
MKLTAKLVLIFTAVVIVMTVINGLISLRQAIHEFERDSFADAEIVALQIENLFPNAVEHFGIEQAIRLIEKHNQPTREVQIRYVEFTDSRRGDLFEPAAPQSVLPGGQQHRLLRYDIQLANGNTFIDYYWTLPEQVADGPCGIEISQSTTMLQETKGDIIRSTLWHMFATIVASGLMIYLVGVRVVGRPLRQLVEKTRRVSEGDMTGPIDLGTNDELGELAQSLNVMSDKLTGARETIKAEAAARIAATDQLRHTDRLRTVGRLASGMAHELGTPLNVVSGRAELIASGKLSDEEVKKSAHTIKGEADRMTGIIHNLLDFARRRGSQRVRLDLRKVVKQVFDLLSYLGEKHNVRMRLDSPDVPFEALLDSGQFQQVLTNLIVNAGQAMPEGGEVVVTLSTQHATPPPGNEATAGTFQVLEVADQGQGIDPQHIEHIFDPFFTTKEVGQGTGLGLSIAYGIVQDHGGWISVRSQLGQGSTFAVFLPLETNT